MPGLFSATLIISAWQVSYHSSVRRYHIYYIVILGNSNQYNAFNPTLLQGLLICSLQAASREPNHPTNQRLRGANLDVKQSVGRSRTTKILLYSISSYKKDSRQELDIDDSKYFRGEVFGLASALGAG